jgi:hypothetical protein
VAELGKVVTQDTLDAMQPNKTDAWLARHEAALRSKFPSMTRQTHKRINMSPNDAGFIEVEWIAHDD